MFLERVPPIILVAVGGAIGAMTRYLITLLFKELRPIPWGTLTVNVIGSFALGIIVTAFQLGVLTAVWIPLLGVGFMGSFTTMSSFAIETISLTNEAIKYAIMNFVLMMVLVFVFAFLGRLLILCIYKGGSPL